MTGVKGLPALRRLIAERYETLRTQVARRVKGPPELVEDALHDAYVRLASRDSLDDVTHPQSYLVSTAVNAAIDRMRSDNWLLSEAEVAEFFEIPEPVQTAQVAGARHDLDRLSHVLDALPPRQRDILIAARVHDMPREELAKRWGISVSMVGRELLAAHRYCVRAMAHERGAQADDANEERA